MNINFNIYHLVNISPWPVLAGLSSLRLVLSTIIFFKIGFNILVVFILMLLIAIFWWRDVIREAYHQGMHPFTVISSLKIGILLFITSEVFFFISFFWIFFHRSISPVIEIGQLWPPIGITTFNPIGVPLLNTIVLVSSGASITWSHHLLLNNKSFFSSLIITIILGVYFTILQTLEYLQSSFTIFDSVFGNSFFMITGFHGIHVIIGSLFLSVILLRSVNRQLNRIHLVGFEASAWYWHFVDVVWLFLYLSIYWWGS